MAMKNKLAGLALVVLAVLVVLSVAYAPGQGIVARVVELPQQLQAVIAVGVAGLVALALKGRVPDEYLSEISVAISTGLITIIGVLLRLIPLEFEGIATAILNLIVVLLGTVWVAGLLRKGAVRVGLLQA
jgi:hypothetical protein